MNLTNLFHLFHLILWSSVTIFMYQLGKFVYRRRPAWWSSPLMVAPVLLIALASAVHLTYKEYSASTHWLVVMLAPACVAFAIPIYEQRQLILRNWILLSIGVLVGSTTAMLSGWGLSTLFGLSDEIRLSLLPRSFSTPFAVIVSGDIGGIPGLTAMFVLITGILGAAIGEILLKFLPVRSVLARGALFGMGAHAAGTAKASQIDEEIGAIAGLIMVMVGAVNVLAAPLVAIFLK